MNIYQSGSCTFSAFQIVGVLPYKHLAISLSLFKSKETGSCWVRTVKSMNRDSYHMEFDDEMENSPDYVEND
jgi:hypothetical protein